MNTRELVDIWLRGLTTQDWSELEPHIHPDYTERYPQTGEVFKGRDTWKEMINAWPNLPTAEEVEIQGSIDSKVTVVRSPMPLGQPVIHVTEGDGHFSGESRVRYPDGSEFFLVFLGKVEKGLLRETVLYWAAPDEPAEWRKPFAATD